MIDYEGKYIQCDECGKRYEADSAQEAEKEAQLYGGWKVLVDKDLCKECDNEQD